MIVYNYGKEPVFIEVGVIADPFGGPGMGKQTLYLPPNANGGIDLCAFGIYTKEEHLAKTEKGFEK